MLTNTLLFLLGFALLIQGAGWLVNGSVSFARKFKVSELAIGLTIVAFGTSTPEMVVNVVASINKYNDVVMGNIVGSNIFNLLCILGLSAMIYPITVDIKSIRREIPYSLLAALLLLLLVNDMRIFHSSSNVLQRLDGYILLIFFSLFIYYIFKNLKEENQVTESGSKEYSLIKTLLLISAGLAGLFFGGKLVVNNAVEIAKVLGISERIIGLTIISAGTSLPELATSSVAAYKKRSDLALGNVIGSNIFNIFFILGISAIISPTQVTESFNNDIFLLIIATLMVLLAMFTGKKKILDRWEGALFFTVFVLYILWLIY